MYTSSQIFCFNSEIRTDLPARVINSGKSRIISSVQNLIQVKYVFHSAEKNSPEEGRSSL